MISDLTDRQLNKLSGQKAGWLDEIFKAEQDEISIAQSALELCKAAGLGPGLKILVAEGPARAHSFARALLGVGSDRDNSQLEQASGYTAGQFSGSKNKADQLFARSLDIAAKAKQSFHDNFTPRAQEQLRNMLFWDINHQVSQSAFNLITGSGAFKKCARGYHTRPAIAPSFSDWDWLSFYSTVQSISESPHIEDPAIFKFLKSGGFQLLAFSEFAVAISRPTCIVRNQSQQLHAEEGPSVKWADNTALYFWNGVEVPAKLIEKPEQVSREDILTEHNAEVRRCYQEILGSEAFGQILGLLELDRKADQFGEEVLLYRSRDKDKLAGDFIYFARVICPSTGRKYFLCVPPTVKTADEAVAWTFGKSPDEYRPSIET